jgi:hypothetical protein
MSRRHNKRRRANRRRKAGQPPVSVIGIYPPRNSRLYAYRVPGGWSFTLNFSDKPIDVPGVGQMFPMIGYEIHPTKL